ncbi:MAG: tyrosine-type recombinase/integrase [Paenibacillaceae bacterium]
MSEANNSNLDLAVSIAKETSIFKVITDYNSFLSKQLQSGVKSPMTIKKYKSFLNHLSRFLKNNYDQLTLGELNETILLNYFSTCSGRKSITLSSTTQNNYVAIINAMMKYALHYDLSPKDYTFKFPRKIESQLPRYLQDHQIQSVLSNALQQTHGYRYQAIILFLLHTGCRLSEVSNIQINDFNVEDNRILIRNGLGHVYRYIPMSLEVKEVILDYLQLTGVSEWNPNLEGFLFSQDYGTNRQKQIAPRSIQHMCKTIFDKAGYTNLTVNSFRHTFAVRCLKAGMPIYHLSQIMGHSNILTTCNYVQLIPRDSNHIGGM